MRILFIADVIGKPGREIVKNILPRVIREENIQFVIANCENAAGGFGLTPKISREVISAGVDVITMGNHVWARKEISEIIEEENILRPANYPPEDPGKGGTIIQAGNGEKVGVVNLMGRVYMSTLECPFRTADGIIEEISKQTKIIVVDMHAEITSEKVAMGWYLDGKVSAVIGTHTHVPTADERVLPQGTAYITDIGMTGPRDSVIGIKKEIILRKYLTQMPIRFEVAKDDLVFAGAVMEIEEKTGKATSIKRITKPFEGKIEENKE
ncbi:MAG: TIGR00282 family metallophosphoesterase [Elusimicrobiota bacterium]|nr:TIGR00282 family metallophosphoesterase [Elusimicrobiota bacterium]